LSLPICITCEETLVLGQNWTQGCVDNKTYSCINCRAQYQREYYIQNKEKCRIAGELRYQKNREDVLETSKYRYILSKYNLSKEEYHALIDNSVCSICAKTTDLVIDHNHATNKVRGVLCRQCNCGIGLLQDDKELTYKAWEYLNNADE
jgi:hypothetical protein